jgi:hypothetical protein
MNRSELEVILQHRIGYDDDMEPYVKGEDGQPAKTTAGNPLGIDVFVKQYLDNHPHHRKPAPAGAAMRAAAPPCADASRRRNRAIARVRVSEGDRSLDAINELFKANAETPVA